MYEEDAAIERKSSPDMPPTTSTLTWSTINIPSGSVNVGSVGIEVLAAFSVYCMMVTESKVVLSLALRSKIGLLLLMLRITTCTATLA